MINFEVRYLWKHEEGAEGITLGFETRLQAIEMVNSLIGNPEVGPIYLIEKE